MSEVMLDKPSFSESSDIRGLRTELETRLFGPDCEIWGEMFKNFPRKELCWAVFIARDWFVMNTSSKAKVNISYLEDNFRNWMLGLIEESVSSVPLGSFLLDTTTSNRDIIAQIGGVLKTITSLTDVFSEMEAQPFGPKSTGDLLSNGSANIFYVPQPVKRSDENHFSYNKETIEETKDSQYIFEVNGQWYILRAVGVCWDEDGWCVYAFSVEDPYRWRGGNQVFYRK